MSGSPTAFQNNPLAFQFNAFQIAGSSGGSDIWWHREKIPYDVEPSRKKSFRPVWDVQKEIEVEAARPKPLPVMLPPAELFGTPVSPIDTNALPSFGHLVPPDHAQMGERLNQAADMTDVFEALDATADALDVFDAISALAAMTTMH